MPLRLYKLINQQKDPRQVASHKRSEKSNSVMGRYGRSI